jgi:hypothetical protein
MRRKRLISFAFMISSDAVDGEIAEFLSLIFQAE